MVLPTVDADVAFGLGKINLTNDEVRSRVSRALHAVGLSDYMKVLGTSTLKLNKCANYIINELSFFSIFRDLSKL